MAIKQPFEYDNFFIVEHPLIQHKLTLLRDKHTNKKDFNDLLNELTLLLVYEASSKLRLTSKTIDTPLARMEAKLLVEDDPVIVPILRAGLGMVPGFLRLLPNAKVGHVGIYRSEDTFDANQYYFKIPERTEHHPYFLCDPMLATGGSVMNAIQLLRSRGITEIHFVAILAAPEGAKKLAECFPEIDIYVAALDEGLDENAYILPGLGDAGDRLFGTV